MAYCFQAKVTISDTCYHGQEKTGRREGNDKRVFFCVWFSFLFPSTRACFFCFFLHSRLILFRWLPDLTLVFEGFSCHRSVIRVYARIPNKCPPPDVDSGFQGTVSTATMSCLPSADRWALCGFSLLFCSSSGALFPLPFWTASPAGAGPQKDKDKERKGKGVFGWSTKSGIWSVTFFPPLHHGLRRPYFHFSGPAMVEAYPSEVRGHA